MRTFLRFSMLCLASLLSMGVYAHDFEAKNGDEVTIYYNITSVEDKTVEVSFHGDTQLKYSGAIVIPETVSHNDVNYHVTRIGNSAFNECENLTAVSMPNSIISIGDHAFNYCNNLQTVGMSNSIQVIEQYAFHYCHKLTSIILPNTLVEVGDDAFNACIGLTSINIPSSLTKIGKYAFNVTSAVSTITVDSANPAFDSRNDCNAIIETSSNTLLYGCRNTTIPNSVTSIQDGAFYQCLGLVSIDIPNSVQSIGNDAFCYCSDLEEITIPKSVQSIGTRVFLECTKLKDLYVQWTVPIDVEANCFAYGNHTRMTLHVPSGTKAIYEAADVWKDFGTIIEGIPNNEIWYTASERLEVAILDSGSGLHTNAFNTSITSHTFSDGHGVIKFSEDLTSIGEWAFFGCSNLTSITLPNSVTSIGNYAFQKCSGLSSINIPNSVTSIGSLVFTMCPSLPVENNIQYADTYLVEAVDKTLSTYSIKKGTKWIGCDGFQNCSNLTSITIPNSVAIIGVSAFQRCSRLSSITIPNSVTSIENYAFSGCSNLTTITIPNSVTSIGSTAFSSCTGLSSISVDSGNSKYDSRENCNAIIETSTNTLLLGCLNTIIPNSVTIIGGSAFQFSYISSITIPNSVTSIESGAFSTCVCLKSVSIPNSVKNIGTGAFYGCSNLRSITIPNSVTTIGNNAFYACPLTSIAIPNSVTSIGKSAFYNCKNLTDITVSWSTPLSVNSDTFGGSVNLSNATLHVPAGTKALYQAADVWKDFGTIEEVIPNDEIWYTSSNGNIIVPYKQDAFGANIVSNTYTDGKGVIKFDKPVTKIGVLAFYSSGIETINIPNSVDSIFDQAFIYCGNLKSVYIPSTVKFLSWRAYAYCSNLTSIKVDKENTKYNDGNGANCIIETSTNKLLRGCKNTIIPNYVTTICAHSFSGCRGLTSITIPNSVTSIESDAFTCYDLENITIPSSVRSIGYGAFGSTIGIKSIIVDDGNLTYNDGDGSNCIIESSTGKLIKGCKNTIMSDRIKAIGRYAFWGCTGLASISIPNSVEIIEGEAFGYCSDATTLELPKSLTSIGYHAFIFCTNLKNVSVEWSNPSSVTLGIDIFFNVTLSNATLHVPAGTKTLYEAADVWKDFGTIEEVIPNDEIWYTSSNGNIVTPNKQDAFGANIVSNTYTDGKGVIKFDKPVTKIGVLAFYSSGIETINIPNSVDSILDQAFIYCSGLKSVYIPSTVKYLNGRAYAYCSNLASIKVDKENTKYNDGNGSNCIIETSTNKLFRGCKNTIIPNYVTTICENAFSDCRGLTSITIPNSVTNIDAYAFDRCYELENITIPSSVRSIEYRSFDSCLGLNSIAVDEGNLTYNDGNGSNCIIESSTDKLVKGCKNTIMSDKIKVIGSHAFFGCTGLASISIPNSVEKVEYGAFAYCSDATTLELPKSLTSIERDAFAFCTNLNNVSVEWSNPSSVTLGIGIFFNVTLSNATLHVPAGTKTLYEAADVWKDFGTIIEETLPHYDIDDNSDPTTQLAELVTDGKRVDLTINRTYYRKDYLNTVCFPFSLSAAEIAASPLGGYKELKQFDSAEVTGSGTNTKVNVRLRNVDHIEAGYPYLMSWRTNSDIVNPTFKNVLVTESVGKTISGGGMSCTAVFAPTVLDPASESLLFLGANNLLYWSNDKTPMKGFRAYFSINKSHEAKIRRGMTAVFIDIDDVTGIETIINDEARPVKYIEDGKVVIEKNGVKYDTMGRVVK